MFFPVGVVLHRIRTISQVGSPWLDLCSLYCSVVYPLLVTGGNDARPQYLQYVISAMHHIYGVPCDVLALPITSSWWCNDARPQYLQYVMYLRLRITYMEFLVMYWGIERVPKTVAPAV